MNRMLRAGPAVAAFLLGTSIVNATPLDVGSWTHVARMADGDAGMFDGNGNLQSTYTFGTNTGNPMQSNDFQIPFNVYTGMDILFITGDHQIWGKTSYSTLRSLIDAQGGAFAPNIAFNARVNGVEQSTMGNVLSRGGFSEDPWISLLGDHGTGIAASLILWGEGDYAGPHITLKQLHGGVNVYVSNLVAQTPIPGALPLFASVLGLFGFVRWIRAKLEFAKVACLAKNVACRKMLSQGTLQLSDFCSPADGRNIRSARSRCWP